MAIEQNLIKAVYKRNRKLIPAQEFLCKPERQISRLRKTLSKKKNKAPYLFCSECGEPVYLKLSQKQKPFFSHYSGAANKCPWNTGKIRSIKDIDRMRFNGALESALHKQIKEDLYEILKIDDCFYKSAMELWIIDENTKERKRPDVISQYKNKQVVFELQLSTTHLPVIVAREGFYGKRGAFLIWIFNDFTLFKNKATAKDIYNDNNCNAYEFDERCMELSKDKKKLHLRVHWKDLYLENYIIKEQWNNKIIPANELTWDEETHKVYYYNYDLERTKLLRKSHSDFVNKFEIFWINRNKDKYREMKAVYGDNGEIIRRYTIATESCKKAFHNFNNWLELEHEISWDDAYNEGFPRLLDMLYFMKNGINHYNGLTAQGEIAVFVNNASKDLKYHAYAAHAAARAYECEDILKWSKLKDKLSKILEEEQYIHYYPIIYFLFPETIEYLRY